MRYKILALSAILLLSTPLIGSGQEFSPIIVYTGKPSPSVVKTGELFVIIYRAEFIDEVMIDEKAMQPGNIDVSPFEVVNLWIDKHENEAVSSDKLGNINTWDFIYTFRIIDAEKGQKKMPIFNFSWVLKKAGVTEEETQDKVEPKEFSTEEVGILYVSSIIKPPTLDIRDEIVFDSFSFSGSSLRYWAYGIILCSIFLVVGVLAGFANRPKVASVTEKETAEAYGSDAMVGLAILPRKTLKDLLRELYRMKGMVRSDNADNVEKNLRTLLRLFILSELSGGVVSGYQSETPKEICSRLNSLVDKRKRAMGKRYDLVKDLARRLVNYQDSIESGECSVDLTEEIDEIISIAKSIRLRNRVLVLARRLSKRSG